MIRTREREGGREGGRARERNLRNEWVVREGRRESKTNSTDSTSSNSSSNSRKEEEEECRHLTGKKVFALCFFP